MLRYLRPHRSIVLSVPLNLEVQGGELVFMLEQGEYA